MNTIIEQLKRMTKLKRIAKTLLLAAMLLVGGITAKAADYVFTYNGGYLAVDNSGNVIYTTTLSPQCVWTCVSSATNLTAATLGTTSYYLYTTDVNGTRRWLIGSNSNGTAITTSTNAGTARWRADGTRLFWRQTNSYYAYYRENTWRTSNSSNGNSNGVNAYRSGNNSGTDYRSTTYQVTVTTVASTSSGPTINGADVLTATGNSTYTATGAAYRIGYTNYQFNNADHYVDADGNSFTGTPANATITNTWSLTDNAYASVNSTSGVVTVTSLPEYDIALTLTVTATATGGNPAAPAGTTLTDTKTITIQGTKPSAPIISVSGNSATLSTDAPGSTTIRYTLDGTDPTATTGTVYSGTIDLSSNATSPITLKAVTVRDGNASEVVEQTITLTLPEPTITINGEAQTATISSSIAGATIYYTTNGTTPTTSSSQYTGTLTGLSYMTTIKAIAVKDGWNSSPAASDIVTIPSGVGGGVVTLFDYEPHSWSYYSDAECPIHSLNPADVKITYFGDGIVMSNNNDYTAGTSNYVSPGNTNYTGGAKVNVGGQDENTFIYYKTLERTDGSTSANPTGRCLYTTIPNPFQVRPTYGPRGNTDANNFTGWRGFQCWRLKSVSGGSVYSAATGGTALATGAIINGETDIYFAPSSEYGMEVELEAVWARAYVVKGDQGGANNILAQNVGVERNFMILTSGQNYRFDGTSGRYIGNKGYAATISNYYPNGETGNTASTVSGYNNMTLEADTKFENITFNSMASYTLTAANHNLIIGRGCSGTVGTLSGLNANSTNTFRFRIESGQYNYLYFMGSYGVTTGHMTAVMGCDYDRANNKDNSKLRINTDILLSNSGTVGTTGTVGTERFRCTVKSGNYDLGSYGGNVQYYMSSPGQSNYARRTLFIEGGNFSDVSGGMESNTVGDHLMFYLRVTGGTINGATYGAAQNAAGSGHRRFIITGGEFKGWIAGGANGTNTTGGALTGNTQIYFGGDAVCSSNGNNTTIGPGQATGGNIFGAGSGNSGASTTATVGQVESSTVIIADECEVEHCVYGGGNYGFVSDGSTHKSDIRILGGTVHEKVFGGSNNQRGQNVEITMKGGIVEGGIYGGSNTTGTINYNVEMNINGGQVGTPSASGNIHGGGYGNSTVVSGNVDLTLGTDGQTTPGVTVYGDVYGGSALGSVNGTSATNTYHTYVTLNKGIINGSLYGGALGSSSVAANVYGPVKVTVNGGSVRKTDANGANGSGGVYGANNINGAPQGAVTVDIYHTDPAPSANEYALYAVYGGGNHADYLYGNGYPKVSVRDCENSIEYVYGGGNAADVASTEVKIYGGNVIGNVFGGGNGTVTPANVTGNAQTYIYGGTILKVFGGSNSQGTIGGTIKVDVAKDLGADCPMHVGEIYGGGNMANSQAGSITIGCTGSASNNEAIDYVYGGANQANISGNIELNITGGRINNVYGGNNTSGTVSGTITVNVNWADNGCDNYLGNVYGGGNLAEYSAPSGSTNYPVVNIKDGTVSGSVFGGGNGDPNSSTQEPGQVTGNPQVTIGDNDDACHAIVRGNVYGGGNAAKVTGDTFIHLKNRAKVFGNIYGGGNMGPVDGNTNVIVNGKRL